MPEPAESLHGAAWVLLRQSGTYTSHLLPGASLLCRLMALDVGLVNPWGRPEASAAQDEVQGQAGTPSSSSSRVRANQGSAQAPWGDVGREPPEGCTPHHPPGLFAVGYVEQAWPAAGTQAFPCKVAGVLVSVLGQGEECFKRPAFCHFTYVALGEPLFASFGIQFPY